MVNTILFGFSYTVKFKGFSKSNSSRVDIKGALAAKLSKLTSAFTASLSGSGSWEKVEKDKDYNIWFQVVGDVELPSKSFENLTQVLEYVKFINRNLTERSKNEGGKVLTYFLSPSEILSERKGMVNGYLELEKISEKDSNQALEIIESAEKIYMHAKELLLKA